MNGGIFWVKLPCLFYLLGTMCSLLATLLSGDKNSTDHARLIQQNAAANEINVDLQSNQEC